MKPSMKQTLQIMQDLCNKTATRRGLEDPITLAVFQITEDFEQEYYTQKEAMQNEVLTSGR